MKKYVYNERTKFQTRTHLNVSVNDLRAVLTCQKQSEVARKECALIVEIAVFEEELDLRVICALCCTIEVFFVKEAFISIEIDETRPPFNYLEGIGFFNQWSDRESWFIKPDLGTSFGLIRFQKERIDSLNAYLSLFFSKHELTKDKDITVARLVITEALNNIADHSIWEIGFATAQIYPTRRVLEFVVCDFGVGIPSSLFDNASIKAYNHLDLLWKSIERGVSSRKQKHNRGMGLNIISEYANQDGCSLEIFSLSARIEINGGERFGELLESNPFKGTLVKLRLDVSTLQIADDDETFDIDF
jgi:hypothetical protein